MSWDRTRGGISCCTGCARRAVGCRSDCEEWRKHETEKTERYNRNKANFAGMYSKYDSLRVNLVQKRGT